MSRDELLAFQDMKLRRLIEHCRQNVPFYGEWFGGKRFPKGQLVRHCQAWRELPVLAKEDIQTQRDRLIATNGRRGRMYENTTGGSTGQPLRFLQDDNYVRHNVVDLCRSYEMCGWRPGDRVLYLWGADLDAADHVGLRGMLADRLLHNRLFVNTFSLENHHVRKYAQQASHFAPDLVIGYASSLDLFAEAVLTADVGIRPRAVQSSAETLDPRVRERIEDAFNAPVFDRYGGRECGVMAHECEVHDGWHIFSNTLVVEILDDDWMAVPDGTMGNIVVTNLNNYAMPFVRYAIGDLGAMRDEPCPCGCSLPLLGRLGGRRSCLLKSPKGKVIPGEYFMYLFLSLDGDVKRYQVIQQDLAHIEIRIEPYPRCDKQRLAKHLMSTIPSHLDDRFVVEVNFDKPFEILPSGKLEFVVSRLDD